MSKPTFKKTKAGVDEDIWDDSLLIKAYEQSVRLQKEEVAKQLAMKTNKKIQQKADEKEESEPEETETSTEEVSFKVGDFVRATFSEDGIDYEAQILMIRGSGCLIRYIGYNNEECVQLENLIPSWGPEAREEQKLVAEADQQSPAAGEEDEDHQEGLHQFVLNKSQNANSSLPVPPMPPMPPGMFDNTKDSECISAMLMSWYMSGYYTGVYHGRKQAQEEIQCQPSTSDRGGSPSKKKKSRKNCS